MTGGRPDGGEDLPTGDSVDERYASGDGAEEAAWRRELARCDAGFRFAWMWLLGWTVLAGITVSLFGILLTALTACGLLAGIIGGLWDVAKRRRLLLLGMQKGWHARKAVHPAE